MNIKDAVTKLVEQFRKSRATRDEGYAQLDIGKCIEVRVQEEGSRRWVEVSTASHNSTGAVAAAEFAADLTLASHIAAGVESALKD